MRSIWLLSMLWEHICFCHWRIPRAFLEPHVPNGWELDLYDGDAWISIVPFTMREVRLRGMPVFRGFQYVPEVNLRTYIRCGSNAAVLFFSLDATSAILVRAARITTGLPYMYAAITLDKTVESAAYRLERIDGYAVPGEFIAKFRHTGIASAANAGSLDEFLHERYLFVTRRGLVGRVAHEPYQIESATVTIAENTLGNMIGYAIPFLPDRVTYAERLSVQSSYAL